LVQSPGREGRGEFGRATRRISRPETSPLKNHAIGNTGPTSGLVRVRVHIKPGVEPGAETRGKRVIAAEKNSKKFSICCCNSEHGADQVL